MEGMIALSQSHDARSALPTLRCVQHVRGL